MTELQPDLYNMERAKHKEEFATLTEKQYEAACISAALNALGVEHTRSSPAGRALLGSFTDNCVGVDMTSGVKTDWQFIAAVDRIVEGFDEHTLHVLKYYGPKCTFAIGAVFDVDVAL